ncbi:MAG: LPS translocon maturation chaperone LptM [Gammaproteobacteria bacterium]
MRAMLLAVVMFLPACGQMGPLYLPPEEEPALEEPEAPPEDDEIESEDDLFDTGPEAS